MPEKKRFEYNSVQDVETIKDYLGALIEGFEKGELELVQGGETMKMFPRGLLGFSLEATAKGGQRKLKLRIRWQERSGEEELSAAPLIVRAGGD